MLIVGLTGGIGSGKSSCCAAFSRLGITIIDTDEIAHQLSRPYADANLQIAEQFGANALLPDHSLNRKWLRQHILTDAYEKKRLEAIFHPKILDQVKEKIRSICAKERYCIIDVPLLFETSSFLNLIDYSIAIDCDEQEQIKRVKCRSQLTENEIKSIIAVQISRKQRNKLADFIILNNGKLSDIDEKILQIHKNLLEKV